MIDFLLQAFLYVALLLTAGALAEQRQTASLEGVVNMPLGAAADWPAVTRIQLDGGLYVGFVRANGSFYVNGLPLGSSFLLEVQNPQYTFMPTRVDINSKGKVRVRRVNNLKPTTVVAFSYPPLLLTPLRLTPYFQPREQLRTMDMLMNPSILITVLALFLIMVLPKMVDANDPELQQMSMMANKQSMPDFGEMLSNFMSGSQPNDRANRRQRASNLPSARGRGQFGAAASSNEYTAVPEWASSEVRGQGHSGVPVSQLSGRKKSRRP